MESVPNSWDQEDWGNHVDKNPASVIVPQILQPSVQPIFATAQPKILLKRSSNTTTPPPTTTSPTAAGAAPKSDTPRKEETEKERRDRERKEKERRYKEARDKIFSSPSPTPPEKQQQQQQSKPKAKPTPAPSPSPSRNNSKKRTEPIGGAITGFSLNGGEFSTAPLPNRPARSIGKVDEKMLESQLLISDDVLTVQQGDGSGSGEALEWDSFKRDTCWRAVPGNAEFVPRALTPQHERDRSEPQVLRAPRGPDIDGGKGFRGRGKPGFVREFVPGSTAWGE